MIPYGRQNISEADIASVVETLQSDWLTQGPAIEKFELALSNYTGASHAVAACNATAALHLACRALDLKHGDILWTSPNTFVASANCALYCGASVDFVDIDPITYNMSPEALEQKLKIAEKKGKLPKIIVPVHFAGLSCDMKSISALAKKYGCAVIEDASHAIGADYEGKKVGCCAYSDIAIFSFHPVKIITTGEGGVAMTNRTDLAQKMQLLRSHGITRDQNKMQNESQGAWYYQQIDLGFNYRITDLQAALGLSQLKRLDQFIVRRREIAATYHAKLRDLSIQLPHMDLKNQSSWHLYVIRVDNRKKIFDQLREAKIGVNVHYIPVHTQPYYQKMGFKWGDFPNAERYYCGAISLPIFYDLKFDRQNFVIQSINSLIDVTVI